MEVGGSALTWVEVEVMTLVSLQSVAEMEQLHFSLQEQNLPLHLPRQGSQRP